MSAPVEPTVSESVLAAWLSQREQLCPEWVRAASLQDHALRLTPRQARELADELTAQWPA